MIALTSTTAVDQQMFENAIASIRGIDLSQVVPAPAKVPTLGAATIKEIRSTTGLSQPKFARLLNVDVGTLRSWEQGRREPAGSARALLKAIKNDPQSVLRALAA